MKSRHLAFEELFDLEQVQALQDAFSKAMGLASVITRPDGTPITRPSQFTHFCYDVVRGTEKGLELCKYSDAVIGNPADAPYTVSPCLSAGLMDGGASIKVGDVHIANWLMGQVLEPDKDLSQIMEYAREIGADEEEFARALDQVPRMTREQFEHVAEFMHINVRMLSYLAMVNLRQKEELALRLETQARLRHERELLGTTIQSIGDGILMMDRHGEVWNINPAAEEITGWSREEAKGMAFSKVFSAAGLLGKGSLVEQVLEVDGEVGFEALEICSKQGRAKTVAGTAAPIRGSKEISGVVLVFRDVTLEMERTRELEFLSYNDQLTGLYNRNYYYKESGRWLSRENFPVTVILGDVNSLKITNDLLGHEEGDRLLVNISKALREATGPEDKLIRWGGDEFLLVLPRTDRERGEAVAERISRNCLAHMGEMVVPSMALGLDTQKDPHTPLDGMIKRAEDRMYRNKLLESKSGRSGTVASLQRTLYERSYETEEHAQRLVTLSQEIGRRLGLDASELDDLKLYAILHDIGKIGVPDSILTKPGRLDEAEWEEMKKHSEAGFRIAQSASEIAHVAEYIYSHHESYDGSGYPRGLSGDEIPLFSRILLVVDSFDAMVSARVYKEAMMEEEALEEIRRCSGGQFDPAIVSIFLDIMR